METNLSIHIPVEPLDATQGFIGAPNWINATVGDYWRWAYSNVHGNTARGMLAQFIVAKALGDSREAIDIWAAYDVIASDGTKVEVKSAAYLQSWSQRSYSRIQFTIAKTLGWDDRSGDWEGNTPDRHSDAYVFALLTEKDKEKVDPLNLGQWEFYVVPTRVLDTQFGEARSISLARLRTLATPVAIAELPTALASARA